MEKGDGNMDDKIFRDAKRQLVEDAAVNNELISETMLRLAKYDLESYLGDPVKLKEEFKHIGKLMGVKPEVIEKYMDQCVAGYKKLYSILKMAIEENIEVDYDRVKRRVIANRERREAKIKEQMK